MLQYLLLGAGIGLAVGLVGAFVYLRFVAQVGLRERDSLLKSATAEADRLRKQAELEAKDEVFRSREKFEKEVQELRREMRESERRLVKREESLDRRVEMLTRKEKFLETTEKKLGLRQNSLREKADELEKMIQEEMKTLHNLASLSKEEATRTLLQRLEKEVVEDESRLIQKIVERAKETADQESANIIALALQRCAADHTAEHVVAAVDIPNDEMKGRIIGREGRNIRAFEKATGIDVIVDDTPGVVIVSGFDSIRREMAKVSMERLIADGRIHPARIEEVVAQVRRELEDSIREEGKRVCLELELQGIHAREVNLLGRLKYRSSLGQNALRHSVEVAQLAGLMAGELKCDVTLAKRCGLLHDIGKALDHEMEGSHAQVGADFARRCDEKKEVVNAIAAHHGEVPPESIYAVIVQVANTISNSRLGGRRESLEKYIKRMERLEQIAASYLGVEQAYAIQAGREVRVIVDASTVNDKISLKIARDIAKKIEEEMTYPGEVKVTLIRETRVLEYAT
ncbi:MAG: ribonuclease Y [Planctomycetes bacterium]|nr:ribonuclease Y [Planctomycetota bacterium]MBI3847477.1 ribonuclease Y [Planctomycetota bacterium]